MRGGSFASYLLVASKPRAAADREAADDDDDAEEEEEEESEDGDDGFLMQRCPQNPLKELNESVRIRVFPSCCLTAAIAMENESLCRP